jgi:hypothetical protein
MDKMQRNFPVQALLPQPRSDAAASQGEKARTRCTWLSDPIQSYLHPPTAALQVLVLLEAYKVRLHTRRQGSQQAKTHAYEMYAIWELHACEMTYGRGTHMRDTPMR